MKATHRKTVAANRTTRFSFSRSWRRPPSALALQFTTDALAARFGTVLE